MYRVYNKKLLEEYSEIEKIIATWLSKLEFERINEALKVFSWKISKNPSEPIKIKLQNSLNKLMKETLKLVRGLNKKITKNYSADDIYKINENVKNLETALNQEKIIEFLDKKLK